MAIDLVTGDTLPTLKVSVVDETGASFDLSGMSARFIWFDATGTLVSRVASISGNIASYQFAVGEIFATKMKLELEITNAAGKIITAPSLIELSVREQLG